jgi:hypothetical protein
MIDQVDRLLHKEQNQGEKTRSVYKPRMVELMNYIVMEQHMHVTKEQSNSMGERQVNYYYDVT